MVKTHFRVYMYEHRNMYSTCIRRQLLGTTSDENLRQGRVCDNNLFEFLHVELSILDSGIVLHDQVTDLVARQVDVALLERVSQLVHRDVTAAIAVHLKVTTIAYRKQAEYNASHSRVLVLSVLKVMLAMAVAG